MELRAKYTLFAEGARGNLGKQLIAKFNLGEGREPQKFGLGLKELWQVAPDKHQPGLVQHTFGWPLDNSTGGGSFLYHFDDNLVSVGFVRASQLSRTRICRRSRNSSASRRIRWCATPSPAASGSPMARARSPKAATSRCPSSSFPGGALIGCDAGFMNVPRIKGSHNAMLSGMMAAEAAAAALAAGRAHDELADYDAAWRSSAIGQDLWRVRNAKPLWSKLGTLPRHRARRPRHVVQHARLFAVRHAQARQAGLRDAQAGQPNAQPIAYPKPDGTLTFDRLSSVFLSNTNHEEDQPVHLQVKDMSLQKSSEHDVFAGPSARYCPAGVYEWVEEARRCQICDQCAELRPLQNLRHQGPESEHHLGAAGRRRRAELSEYVTRASRFPSRCCRIRGFNRKPARLPRPRLRGRRKKAILRAQTSAIAASAQGYRPIGASPVTCTSFVRLLAGGTLAAFLAGAPSELSAQSAMPREPGGLTISGSYLAARHAGRLRDAAAAANYYRAALRLDPKNDELLDRTFLSLVIDGNIGEAVKFADRVMHVDKNDRVGRLVLGVHGIKQKQLSGRAPQSDRIPCAGRSPISPPRCSPPGRATAQATPRLRSRRSTG